MKKYPDIKTKTISLRYFDEYHITINNLRPSKGSLSDLLSGLKKKDIKILKIAFLGNPKAEYKKLRLSEDYPVIIIKNSQKIKNDNNFSIHINAVKGKAGKLEYIRVDGKVVGTYLVCPDFECLSLVGLSSPNDKRGKSFEKETTEIYETIDRVLTQYNFSTENIFRFWNFLSNISRTYLSFNKVRDGYFSKHHISPFPAATGIEVGLVNNKKINLGLEAIKFKNRKQSFRPVKSEMQCEASAYGPRFSRAALVSLPPDVKKLYISGTSTVNRKGKTILEDKCDENIDYVMSCVDHLLKKNRMELDDLVMSYAYFKNKKMYEAFKHIYKKNKWAFPYNPIFSNICRNNFTFEIECIAAKK